MKTFHSNSTGNYVNIRTAHPFSLTFSSNFLSFDSCMFNFMVAQMVQNSVFFTIGVQSYFIHIPSSFLYSVSRQFLYSVSLLIYIQSNYIYSVSSYMYSVWFYLYSVNLYVFSHMLYLLSSHLFFENMFNVLCVTLRNLIKIGSFLKKSECMSYRTIFQIELK